MARSKNRRGDGGLASTGFPPIAGDDARMLILGSLPSKASLEAREYYAHPRNAFWRIMRAVFGAQGTYELRCARLIERRIAVWDVLASSVRPGSLDAAIDLRSARPNDFETFFASHDAIRLVCFNGRKAEQLFRRFVPAAAYTSSMRLRSLPSTSPAHASMRFEDKLEAWRGAIDST